MYGILLGLPALNAISQQVGQLTGNQQTAQNSQPNQLFNSLLSELQSKLQESGVDLQSLQQLPGNVQEFMQNLVKNIEQLNIDGNLKQSLLQQDPSQLLATIAQNPEVQQQLFTDTSKINDTTINQLLPEKQNQQLSSALQTLKDYLQGVVKQSELKNIHTPVMPGDNTQVGQAIKQLQQSLSLPASLNSETMVGKEVAQSSQLSDQIKAILSQQPTTQQTVNINQQLTQLNSIVQAIQTNTGLSNSISQYTHSGATPTLASSNMLISTPFNSDAWTSSFSEKIQMMSNQNVQEARIHINPPELGPISARLKISNDTAELILVSHHPVVRETLEQQLPQLRESFQNSQLNLSNVSVQDGKTGNEFAQNSNEQPQQGQPQMTAEQTNQPSQQQIVKTIEGLVDLFA